MKCRHEKNAKKYTKLLILSTPNKSRTLSIAFSHLAYTHVPLYQHIIVSTTSNVVTDSVVALNVVTDSVTSKSVSDWCLGRFLHGDGGGL